MGNGFLIGNEMSVFDREEPQLSATGVQVHDRDTALRYVGALFVRLGTYPYCEYDRPLEAVYMLSAGLQCPMGTESDLHSAVGLITRGVDTLMDAFVRNGEALLRDELLRVAPALMQLVRDNADGAAANMDGTSGWMGCRFLPWIVSR